LLRRQVPGSDVSVCCPEGIGSSTGQLLENLGITPPASKLCSDVDLAVLVDTNTLEQLGKAADVLRGAKAELVVVDHHHPHPDTRKAAGLFIVDESAAAAAEVVFDLAQSLGEPLEAVESTALLTALYVETKHFILARESTFQAAAKLVGLGANPRRLSEILGVPMSRSERIARLKAAGRNQLLLVGNWIIATSELGSYQSSAARALLGLGAHLALVGGEAKEKVRVNMRSTEDFYNKTGVHLGRDLAIPIGKEFGGAGGGHPTAAGLATKRELEETLAACTNRLKELLKPVQT
jgi:nanoRNase/pAp phosphatase (c-di-AMP/oligoRNAs hydrolase)